MDKFGESEIKGVVEEILLGFVFDFVVNEFCCVGFCNRGFWNRGFLVFVVVSIILLGV